MSEDLDAFCPKCKKYKGVGYCPYCNPEKDKEFKEKVIEESKKMPPEEKKFDFETESKVAIEKIKDDLAKKLFEGFVDVNAEEIKEPKNISMTLKIIKLPSVVYVNVPIKCEVEINNQSMIAVSGNLIIRIQDIILLDKPAPVNAQEQNIVNFDFTISNDKLIGSLKIEMEYKIASGVITNTNRKMTVLKK